MSVRTLALLICFVLPCAGQSLAPASLTFSSFDGSSFLYPLAINHNAGIVGYYCCGVQTDDPYDTVMLGFVQNNHQAFNNFMFVPSPSAKSGHAKGINSHSLVVGGFKDMAAHFTVSA